MLAFNKILLGWKKQETKNIAWHKILKSKADKKQDDPIL